RRRDGRDDRRARRMSESATVLAPAVLVSGRAPLSVEQRRLLAWQTEGDLGWARAAVRYEGDVDLPRLRAALERVVRTEPMLRARLGRPPGLRRLLQTVRGWLAPSWCVVDPPRLDAAWQEMTMAGLLTNGHGRRFDLERGPVVRVLVVRVAPRRHILILATP